jgi:uncharacterized protein (DUF2236 family)
MKPLIQSISNEAFTHQLEQRCQWASDPVAGLFGPQSMMWKVSRHSALFLGSWRAALLQLAHPWVAHAIDQHSTTITDPLGRFHRTFRTVFTMVFGSVDQVRRVSEALNQLHSGIKGDIPLSEGAFAGGSAYQANEVQAMSWVNATLWDTSVKMYELLVGPLDPVDKEQFFQEARIFAQLFGISSDTLPDSWVEFERYNQQMWDSNLLHVGDTAKELGQFLFEVDQVPFHRAWMPVARTVTAEVLPPQFREAFGFPPDTEAHRQKFERAIRWIRRSYRLAPPRVKYIPPYYEALQRIKGKKKCDIMTRTASRLWLGQPSLVA